MLRLIWGVVAVLLGGAALSDSLWSRLRARWNDNAPETRSWLVDLAGATFLCAGVFVLRLGVLRWPTQRIIWLVAALVIVFVGHFYTLWKREYRPSAPAAALRLKPWQRVLAVLAGVAMIWMAIQLGSRPVKYRFTASRASGTVIAHHESDDPMSEDFMNPREIVRFTTGGGTSMEFEDRESGLEIVDVGDNVDVLYFPADPAAAIIDRGLWILLLDASIGLFGLLFIAMGIGWG